MNLNDASQFDKEQVQAELAENFEARENCKVPGMCG